MKGYKGFILIIVLIVISILSMLLLASMDHILMYYKQLNNLKVQQTNFYNLEHVAYTLAKSEWAQIQKNCIKKQNQPNQIINEVKKKGCLIKHASQNFLYLFEDIGRDNCLIYTQKKQKFAHHRLRLTVINYTAINIVSILQLGILKLVPLGICLEQENYIKPGIKTWRYLQT